MKQLNPGVDARTEPWWDKVQHTCVYCGATLRFERDDRPTSSPNTRGFPGANFVCPCGRYITLYLGGLPNFPGPNAVYVRAHDAAVNLGKVKGR